ncbi:MAG: UvrB/UvrC motif-containing protein [Thermodesulfobacteriota bacterium]|nr:UvrB/UvrC motif-containing protein [Thermodesulfobacteriota bacterium]
MDKKFSSLDRFSSFGHIRIASYSSQISSPVVHRDKEIDAKRAKIISEIRSLFNQMRKAVQGEDYINAARLRDEIKAMAALL